ncbi:response regulator transcription factor [Paenibacillus sp. S-38]|uniref:response regulator transcription factor n=1 Tax=Paenibacillus sp. S-38 TaxID=3416710 RepID=UPI003CFB99D5
MYKALIIDDELPARRAIRALGPWEQYRITEVLEAGNGLAGLQMMEEHQPQIVLIDMKMPQLGGVELMRQGGSVCAAKFIVVSGYDDFSYTRSAIQAGAVDYLLKPVRAKELASAVGKAVELLDLEALERKRELENGILSNLSVPLLKETIFSAIIGHNGRLHEIPELAEFVNTRQDDLFRVLVLSVLNLEEVCRERFKGDYHACYYALTNAVNELMGESTGEAFSFKSARYGQELVVILPGKVSAWASGDLQAVMGAVTRLQAFLGFDCIAAWGGKPCCLAELDKAYHSARESLLQTDLLRGGTRSAAEAGVGTAALSVLAVKEKVQHALEMGSGMVAAGVLRQYFAAVRAGGRFTAEMMLQALADFRLLAVELLADSGRAGGEPLAEYDRLFRSPVMRFEAFEEQVTGWFEGFITGQLQRSKPPEKFDVAKVRSYIDARFHEELPIASLTERFYLSKEHLHRLFKQQYGSGIHEYVLKLRMEKARELLGDPALKIQTVCERVGYRDQNYFSKAFRKYCGASPQEYRSALLVKQGADGTL